MTRNVQTFKACFVKQTCFQQLHGTVKISMWVCHATCQQQRLFNTGFALILRDPVFQRRGVLDYACGEVGHHVITFVCDALCCGDHILNRGALDMGNVNACALWQ